MSLTSVELHQQLKDFLACCTLGLIFSNTNSLNSEVVSAFKLKHNNNHLVPAAVTSRFNNFVPVFNKYSSICIHFKHEDGVYEFIELYKKTIELPILIIEEFDRSRIKECDAIVAFQTNGSANCVEISQFVNKKRTLFYIVKEGTTAELWRSLEACLSVAQSPEVLALSLSDGALLQLSPVFPQPRHFGNTDVTQVLRRRGLKLNLQGTTLSVAIFDYIPFIIFKDGNITTDLQLDDLDGIEALLMKELVRQLNVSVRLLVCEGWGVKLENGSWSGGIAQALQDGAADLSFANLWQILSAYHTFDLSPSLTKIKMAFLVRRPEQIDFRWQSFVTIFKTQVWVAVSASFVLVVAALWAGTRLDVQPWNQSWCSCLLTVFGYFVAASNSGEREGNTRFTLTSWSVFSLLFTTSLSSGIITRLTVPLYEHRVDSLQHLVEGQYYWTVQYYRDYNNDPDLIESMFDLKNKWARLFEKNYKYLEPAEVSTRIKTNKNITFPVQKYGNDFVIIDNVGLNGNKALHGFRLSAEEITSVHVAFGVKKNSPFFEQLSVATLKVLEAGLMTHWKDEVIRRWPQYDSRHLLIEHDIPTFSEPQGLPLYKLQPVFYLLMFGSMFSVCVFLLEVLWSTRVCISKQETANHRSEFNSQMTDEKNNQ